MTNRIFSTLILFCTLASIDVKAQSDDNNYVIKFPMLDDQGQNVVTTIEYYDGLGRISSQTIYQGNAIYGIEQRNYYDGDYRLINGNDGTLRAEARNILAYSGDMGITSAQRNELSNTFTCVQTQLASDGTEIVTAMYYDQKGRVVEKNSKLLGNHLRREQFTSTFTGKILTHTIIDYKGTKEIFRSTTTNNYDATTGILASTDVTTSINEGNEVKKRTAVECTFKRHNRSR